MKNYYFMLILLFGYSTNAQVGINTNNPRATLDASQGSSTTVADGVIPPRLTGDELLAREGRYDANQDGAMVYVTTGRTISTGSVKTIGVTSRGFYVFNAQASPTGLWTRVDTQEAGVPSTAYSAKFSGTALLLGLSLLGNKRTYLNLPQTSGSGKTVYLPSSNVDSSGSYNVTESGIYRISFKYRETGVVANLANATLDIFKNDVPMASTPLAIVGAAYDTGLENLYNLNTNDKITFGTTKIGLLSLDLLNVVDAEIIIHRIR